MFQPGDKIWAVDTGKLPPGSVVYDDVPPGHVTVNATPAQIRTATVSGGTGNPLEGLFRAISDGFYRLPKN